jgi:EmrB/QacA subfamily drug resistance transporter
MHNELTNLKRWLILLNVSVSIFMATLDGSIVNIALPSISQNFGVTLGTIQWVITSYLLAIAVLLLVWGKLSDMYGKRNIFAFGFIMFTLGSALCGFSQSLEMLVAARVLQAIGASATMALSQGIVTSVFPPQKRGKALGITGTMVALGSLVGPGLGGILEHIAGWQSIFFINLPIGIVGTILTFTIIPEIFERQKDKHFDIKGTLFFTTSLLLLFVGLLFVQQGDLPFIYFLPMLAVAAVAAVFFVLIERRVQNPLIRLEIFKKREFSSGLASAYLSFVAISSTLLFLPFYLQNVLKLNPLQAGLLISFYPVTTMIVAPFSGWLSDKISYRPLTVAGMAVCTLILIFMSTFSTSTSYIIIAIGNVILGIGVALFMSPNNSSIMGSVPKEQLGVAGGINALFRNLGMVSGTAFSLLIFSLVTALSVNSLSINSTNLETASFLKGFHAVLIFDAVCCFFAAIVNVSRGVVFRPKKQ